MCHSSWRPFVGTTEGIPSAAGIACTCVTVVGVTNVASAAFVAGIAIVAGIATVAGTATAVGTTSVARIALEDGTTPVAATILVDIPSLKPSLLFVPSPWTCRQGGLPEIKDPTKEGGGKADQS